jgi:hypothetical protein
MRHSSDEFAAQRGARPAKPAIWAEGRQRPRFDLPAFLRVTGDRARGGAAAGLDRLAGWTGRLGEQVARGAIRVPEARLGRLGRALPSHQAVARTVRRAARLLAEAGRHAAGAAPVEPAAFRSWLDTVPQPVVTRLPGRSQTAASPVPSSVPSDAGPAPAPMTPPMAATEAAPRPEAPPADAETLAAIRSAIRTAAVEPRRPRLAPTGATAPAAPEPGAPGAHTLPDLSPQEPAAPGLLFRSATAATAWTAIAIAWPWAALRTGAQHVQGTDLRLLD